MDTVTEKELALAMAQMGGIDIIHRNMTPKEQAEQVTWVRNKIHSGLIENPVVYKFNKYVSDIQNDIKVNGWSFTNFPITYNENRLIGMVSKNEFEFIENSNENSNPQLGDIMIPLEKLVTTNKIDNEYAYKLMKKYNVKKLPVIDEHEKFLGLYVWKDAKQDENRKKYSSLDCNGHFLVGAAVGIGEENKEE